MSLYSNKQTFLQKTCSCLILMGAAFASDKTYDIRVPMVNSPMMTEMQKNEKNRDVQRLQTSYERLKDLQLKPKKKNTLCADICQTCCICWSSLATIAAALFIYIDWFVLFFQPLTWPDLRILIIVFFLGPIGYGGSKVKPAEESNAPILCQFFGAILLIFAFIAQFGLMIYANILHNQAGESELFSIF